MVSKDDIFVDIQGSMERNRGTLKSSQLKALSIIGLKLDDHDLRSVEACKTAKTA